MLIGRRALVALGIPVLTADYDLWIHIDDIATLNAALTPLDQRVRDAGLHTPYDVGTLSACRACVFNGTLETAP